MYQKYDAKEIDLQMMLQSVNTFVNTQNVVSAKFEELKATQTGAHLSNPHNLIPQ
jgi:hypothetical protein